MGIIDMGATGLLIALVILAVLFILPRTDD
jgi:hypothetical protein